MKPFLFFFLPLSISLFDLCYFFISFITKTTTLVEQKRHTMDRMSASYGRMEASQGVQDTGWD